MINCVWKNSNWGVWNNLELFVRLFAIKAFIHAFWVTFQKPTKMGAIDFELFTNFKMDKRKWKKIFQIFFYLLFSLIKLWNNSRNEFVLRKGFSYPKIIRWFMTQWNHPSSRYQMLELWFIRMKDSTSKWTLDIFLFLLYSLETLIERFH